VKIFRGFIDEAARFLLCHSSIMSNDPLRGRERKRENIGIRVDGKTCSLLKSTINRRE